MAGVLVGVSSLGPISEWFLLGPNNYFLATPSNLPKKPALVFVMTTFLIHKNSAMIMQDLTKWMKSSVVEPQIL